MIQLKVKFFNHATCAWEYLQNENGDALFDSHPDTQQAVMRQQSRAYNENEFCIEPYIVCKCGALIPRCDQEKHRCNVCSRVYDRWGKPCVTHAKPPRRCVW